MRERYEQKKDKIKEYVKQDREANKEKMNCDCGSCIIKYN
jgi:hypothetical protein